MTLAEVNKAKEDHIAGLEKHSASKAKITMVEWGEFKDVREYLEGIDFEPFYNDS